MAEEAAKKNRRVPPIKLGGNIEVHFVEADQLGDAIKESVEELIAQHKEHGRVHGRAADMLDAHLHVTMKHPERDIKDGSPVEEAEADVAMNIATIMLHALDFCSRPGIFEQFKLAAVKDTIEMSKDLTGEQTAEQLEWVSGLRPQMLHSIVHWLEIDPAHQAAKDARAARDKAEESVPDPETADEPADG